MIWDATIFEDDEVTPFFGTGDGLGGVVEADFSSDPDHPRAFLDAVQNWSATEIDFPAGASTLGALTVVILDKRLDAADQDTGIVTSRYKDLKGKRLLLRQLHPTLGMVTAFNAVIQTASMGGSEAGLVRVSLQLRDLRERERRQPLFLSNFVIFGADGGQGPAINYGAVPAQGLLGVLDLPGGYLLDAVEPWESVVAGGITHFERATEPSADGVYWGLTPRDAAEGPGDPFNLAGREWPVQASDGVNYYRDFWIRWRPAGSDGPWIELRDMPRTGYAPAYTDAQLLVLGGGAGVGLQEEYPASTLYFGSFDEYDIPETGEAIEFQIISSEIRDDSPFFWDGGTLGDLLKEIYDGVHSLEPPKIQYDPVAMAAFQASTPVARFVLRKRVEDMREWVEKNIYAPIGYAPGFDDQLRIAPVSWAFPDNTQSIPLIDAQELLPVGEFEHGSDNVINTVEFTYIREFVESVRTTAQPGKKAPWWKFWADDAPPLSVPDPTDTRAAWQRLVEVEIRHDRIDPVSVATFGTKKIEYKPVTIRTIAGSDGKPLDGDAVDELGFQVANLIGELAVARFSEGAPKFTGRVQSAAAEVRELRAGSWVRLRYWPPNYDTGTRGVRRYFQITSISDEDPKVRALTLIDGTVEDTSDDSGGIEPGGTDCLSGGVLFPAGGGDAMRRFIEPGRHELVVTCPTTVRVLGSAGGGGGGNGDAGGGGGAGGVRGATGGEIEIEFQPGTHYIDVGDGGNPDVNGEDTIIWTDPLTGLPLDPDVDDPDDAIRCVGGGRGGTSSLGFAGGSGGGAAQELPASGGSSSVGGSGTGGQGNNGGGAHSVGGLATCQRAAGGGGGSWAGAGQGGVASFPTRAGRGGPEHSLAGWDVLLGGGGAGGAVNVAGGSGPGVCGPDFATPGLPGSGFGAGGGGGRLGASATPGSAGGAWFEYSGPKAKLQPPEITSTETTDQNQQTICIEGEDWPPGAVAGFRVRVEYAVNPTEPAASSGLWRLAGYLDAPGCVTTPPVATGATVWHRAVAEAPGYLPSAPGDTTTEDTPETPGLIGTPQLQISPDGVASLFWTPNAFCGAVKIRGKVHALGDATARPLTLLVSLDADDSPYTLDELVTPPDVATLDIECWEDGTYAVQGNTYRVSVQNPPPKVLTDLSTLGSLSNVDDEVDTAPDGALIQLLYEVWTWRTLAQVMADYFHAPRHQLGGDDEIPLDTLGEPTDNTDLDADATRHGLMPKLSGNSDEFWRGDGTWAIPSGGGGSEWSAVVAASNQDVTNSGTLVNDSELTFPVLAGETYLVELLLRYAGSDSSVDMAWKFAFPSSEGFYQFVGARTTSDAIAVGQARFGPTATAFAAQEASGTIASYGESVVYLKMMIVVGSNGDVVFQFANNSAAPGRVSRRLAGSVLRYQKVEAGSGGGSIGLANLEGYGAAGGYIRSNGSAWVRVSGLDFADVTYSGLTTGAVLRATGAATAAFGQLDLADTDAVTGLLPWANVNKTGSSLADLATRSAADLSSGVLADARVQASNVTQHQAALSIAETQIPDGALLARVADAESITGLWEFANSGGLKTDIVAERTAAAGVTVDGLLIKDGSLPTWTGSSAITTVGTLVAGAVTASLVTTGTFGAGDYAFPASVFLPNRPEFFVLGHSAEYLFGGADAPRFQVHTETGGSLKPFFGGLAWRASAAGTRFVTGHTRQTTVGGAISGATILVDGDFLGQWANVGDDGQNIDTIGGIMSFLVDGTPSANRMPTKARISLAEGTADDDIRSIAEFNKDSSFVSGLSAISSGAGLERNRATGSSTITPVVIRARSTTSANDWLTGRSNPWAYFDAYADDVSGLGAARRGGLAFFFEDAPGSLTGAAIKVSSASALDDAAVFFSDLRSQFRGDAVAGQGERSASPLAGTFRGVQARGSNIAGVDLYHDAGNGTGSGGSGKHRWRTSKASVYSVTRPSLLVAGVVASTGSPTGLTRTPTVAIPSGDYTNLLMICRVEIRNSGSETVSTAVSDLGGALTFLDSTTNGTNVRVEYWYLKAPAFGTHTVTVTLSGSARFLTQLDVYKDVDQATTFGTVAKATGNTLTATVNVTSATDELVIDVVAKVNSVDDITEGGGQTPTHNTETTNATTTANVVGGGSYENGAATTTMSWTWPTNNRQWAIMGVPLKPALDYYPNALDDRMQLDAAEDTSNQTPLLLRAIDGTLHRVLFGAAGTGPGGAGRALYFA